MRDFIVSICYNKSGRSRSFATLAKSDKKEEEYPRENIETRVRFDAPRIETR